MAHTVVALAGATGSGKSSLFNALTGERLAAVGVRRPTTATAQACVWGSANPDALLDWVGVPRRHRLGDRDPALDGLVLLDLPDHDSVESSHRVEVDRLLGVVDLLVWVLDPQKYADAAIHDDYLAPLATHAGIMLVALNQADRLPRPDLDGCVRDLRGLLATDGLPEVPVLPVSATTGAGLPSLREVLAERVAGRRAAAERLAADVTTCAESLRRHCGGSGADPVRAAERAGVVPSLAAAAGVDTVVRAVDRAHRSRAVGATGWPPLRWLRRLRPDPLRRLRLPERQIDAGDRTSLPAPSAADRARVSVVVRRFSDEVTDGLPEPWPARVRDTALAAEAELPDVLERAVAGTDLGMARRPRWWRLAGALQWLLGIVALTGALWLVGLFAWSYLQLGQPPVPHVGRLPLPTLLLLAGVLAGLLLAGVTRRIAALGARRRARTARRRLRARVSAAAEATLIAPVADVLMKYERFCAAVRRTLG